MAETRVSIPTLESLRDKFLNDIKRLKIRAGITRPNVAPGSESYIKGEAVASSVLELHAKLAALQDAQMPDSAVEDDLDRLADVWKGLKRSSGAGATGNVKASCTGTVTYTEGLQGTSPDGLRYQIVVTTKATNGTKLPIEGVDTGTRTNKGEGTVITWTSPPSGSAATAKVDAGGLTGGKDADTDATFRARLLDALRHPAESGSWAHYAKWAEESNAAIQKAWVYPALQGPGTVHVAIAQESDPDTYYSRECSAALVQVANLAIVENHPEHADITITTVNDTDLDMVIQLSLPAAKADGGLGGGWVDATSTRWPSVGTTPTYATRLAAAPISATVLRVTTYSAPNNDAYIAIWSNSKKKFEHGRIKSSSLVSGTTYDITLYSAVDTGILSSGDYISPDAEKIDDYGATLAETFAALGPGEKTSDSDILPRGYRHPLTTESWSHQFTSRHVGELSMDHDEIAHVTVTVPTSLPAAASVASSVASAPNILVLGKLAFYPSS